jgi:solute carrier family 25 folate transporter 32
MVNAFLTISREEGLRGLYKGLVPALFLTSHGAIQFAVYESMKKVFKNFRSEEDKNRQPAFVSALLGGGSKIIASTATYPYQVIKSRLQQRDSIVQDPQMGNTKNVAPKYNGMIDCIVKMWRNEGIFGFFRGVIPNALKVAPAAALTFLIYEESMHLLKQAT